MSYKTYEVKVWYDGYKAWYLNGKRLTEKEWKQRVSRR